jgi:Flp pilus assembly protein TadD
MSAVEQRLSPAAVRRMAVFAVTLAVAGCGANSLSQVAQNNDATRPSLVAARTAITDGEAATALGIAKGVLSMEPHNVAAMVAAADAEIEMGNRRSAEKDYRSALAANPGYVPAQLGLGKLAMRDDARAAEVVFRSVLQHAPHNAAALTDLGVALDLQDRHREAQGYYAQAMATNADLTSTRVDLALSLALSGEPLKAEGMLRDATEAGVVPPKVRADYAVAEVMAGHSQEAQSTLQADLSAADAKASVDGLQELLVPKPSK